MLHKARHRAARWLSARTGVRCHRPEYFDLETSIRCNLRCVHCDAWHPRAAARPLTLERWRVLLDEIRAWAGPARVVLGSGEPLLEDDTLAAAAHAQRIGLGVTLVTNGTLIDRDMAHRILDAGVRSLGISLDGVRPETHDRSRGVPGTHAKVMAALGHLGTAGLAPRTHLAAIVAGHNLGELAALAERAERLGLAGIRYQALTAFGGSDWDRLWPAESRAVQDAVDELIRMKMDGRPILNPRSQLEAMKTYFADPSHSCGPFDCRSAANFRISLDGGVRCCPFMEPVGSVAEASLESVWDSPATRNRLGSIRTCRKPCVLMNCHFQPRLRTAFRPAERE